MSRTLRALNKVKARVLAAAGGGGKGAGEGATATSTSENPKTPQKSKEAEGEAVTPPPKTPQSTKKESSKAWVSLEGPDGEQSKVRVKARLSTTDLRKAVGTKTAVPVNYLELKVGNRRLDEARKPAFDKMSVDEIQEATVYWWRSDRLKALMNKKKLPDHFSRGWLGRTVLHYCVLDGDFTLCMEICNQEWSGELMNAQDVLGDTALMFASICGFNDIVELLMDRQAEPDHMNLCGRNALMLAAEHGHHKTEKALLTAGARRGPNTGYHRPDEIFLAELNDQQQVLSSIRVYELAEAEIAAVNGMSM